MLMHMSTTRIEGGPAAVCTHVNNGLERHARMRHIETLHMQGAGVVFRIVTQYDLDGVISYDFQNLKTQ